MQFHELTSTLQAAVGPLILLTKTNRFGRVGDRSRQLAEALRNPPLAERERPMSHLQILIRRARLLRLAITFATLSLSLVAFLQDINILMSALKLELAP